MHSMKYSSDQKKRGLLYSLKGQSLAKPSAVTRINFKVQSTQHSSHFSVSLILQVFCVFLSLSLSKLVGLKSHLCFPTCRCSDVVVLIYPGSAFHDL